MCDHEGAQYADLVVPSIGCVEAMFAIYCFKCKQVIWVSDSRLHNGYDYLD